VSAENDEYSGWPSTSRMIENVEKFWELIHEDRCQQSMSSAHEHCWNQLRSLPGDLKRKFERVLHCCEVCSLTLDKWPEAATYKHVFSYYRRLTRPQLLSLGSWWMTKAGFMIIIQKQSNNHRSGSAHNDQEYKRHNRPRVQQRACSLFFFTWRGCLSWICSS
jgi:hypothetical protein